MTKIHYAKRIKNIFFKKDSVIHFLHLFNIYLLTTYNAFVSEQAQVQVCTPHFLSRVVLKDLTLLTLFVQAVKAGHFTQSL